MARPDFPRSVVDLQERLPDDAACPECPAASRWPEGFRCPACGAERAWVLERRHLWECAACRQRTSVTAGTVMHGTRTPLRLWFWASPQAARRRGPEDPHRPGEDERRARRGPPHRRPARLRRVSPPPASTTGLRLQRRDHPDAQEPPPRAHRAASSLKAWLQGTHRGVSPEHLQVHLDEFVFRRNRRRMPMAAFQTLLGLGDVHEPTAYREITRRERVAA